MVSPSFHYLYGFCHLFCLSQYFSWLSGSILQRSSHAAGCVPACPRLGRKQLSSAAKWQEAAASGSHGNNNFYRLEAEISEGNNPNCHSQVREQGPNGTGLSFKAKCYWRHVWTWLYHPLKGHNNDIHIPARGNKTKQEFCLHKV